MGRKHKHSKDKLYKTVSELHSHHVGPNRDLDLSQLHRRIKFDTCCLSLNTIIGNPVGLVDETNFCYLFDSNVILRFFRKHKHIHPITGTNVNKNDLISLRFHKSPEGQYHCPITLKPLNQYSKIIANRKTGHIYLYDAYIQLNVKANHFKDLITDEPFTRDDIITIQDPSIVNQKWNCKEFHHIKFGLKFQMNSDDEDDDDDTPNYIPKSSEIIKATLEEYEQQAVDSNLKHEKLFGTKQSDQDIRNPHMLDKINSARESDGLMAKSVTSTVMPVINSQLPALLNHEQILYPKVKKRGYISMSTSLGQINIELLCDRTPKTCHNFLQLSRRGYYDETIFHRLIKNFMIQGGDPTGTGKGGESAWIEPFKDEIHRDLKHEGGGVLAMANSGLNTNKSQFYITLKGNWPHLDGKHTVFGRVVGGIDTLDDMNEQSVDKNDRPKQEIKLKSIKIYQDPFDEIERSIDEERAKVVTLKRKSNIDLDKDCESPSKRNHARKVSLVDKESCRDDNISSSQEKSIESGNKKAALTKKIKSNKKSYGDFSNW